MYLDTAFQQVRQELIIVAQKHSESVTDRYIIEDEPDDIEKAMRAGWSYSR